MLLVMFISICKLEVQVLKILHPQSVAIQIVFLPLTVFLATLRPLTLLPRVAGNYVPLLSETGPPHPFQRTWHAYSVVLSMSFSFSLSTRLFLPV